MKIRQSIRAKLVLLIGLSVLVSALCIGGVCLYRVHKLELHDLEEDLNLVCQKEAAILDYLLGRIEQSVNIIVGSTEDKITSLDCVTNDSLREECIEQMKQGIQAVTGNTEGCIASYMRFNPEMSTSTAGIFIQRKSDGSVQDLVPIDITAIGSSDTENAGWYYIPVSRGVPTWMEPYKNERFNKYVISYAVPLYLDGVLIGIVGMDIDLSYVTDRLNEADIYNNGWVNLLNGSETVSFEQGDEGVKSFGPKNGWFSSEVCTLRNGLKLVYSVPKSDLNAEVSTLFQSLIFVLVVLLIICIAFAVIITSNIVRPLQKLTNEALKVTRGNLDVSFNINSKDEVGVLASALSDTADSLKQQMAIVDRMANYDFLTGVRNKRALDAFRQHLEMEIVRNENLEFAILVFDFNALKAANDDYGHKFGDELIKAGSAFVCRAFAHSPVFRFGGDEFIVVARDEDYKNREKLLADFYHSVEAHNDESVHHCLSIACGMAVFNRETDITGDAVFARADEMMYQNKEKMKADAANV